MAQKPLPPNDGNDEHLPEVSGHDELLYSIGQALQDRKTKDAIASLIQAYANELPVEKKRRGRLVFMAHGVSVITMVIIGLMGHFNVITTETAGALMGLIVGAMFSVGRK